MDRETKRARYEEVIEELSSKFDESDDLVARMATMAAILHDMFEHFFWTGFYTMRDGDLTVGPYQGSPACVVLEPHKGVCWAGIDRAEPVVVPNVHEFPDHIACDGRANSEIVLPVRDPGGEIIGVLDVDSADFDSFDDTDVEYLVTILRMLHAGSSDVS